MSERLGIATVPGAEVGELGVKVLADSALVRDAVKVGFGGKSPGEKNFSVCVNSWWAVDASAAELRRGVLMGSPGR